MEAFVDTRDTCDTSDATAHRPSYQQKRDSQENTMAYPARSQAFKMNQQFHETLFLWTFDDQTKPTTRNRRVWASIFPGWWAKQGAMSFPTT